MKEDRTTCINPRCRRTAPANKFHGEIICGKCFRNLPEAVRKDHRRYWHEIRKWDRRIVRTADAIKAPRIFDVLNGTVRGSRRGHLHQHIGRGDARRSDRL